VRYWAYAGSMLIPICHRRALSSLVASVGEVIANHADADTSALNGAPLPALVFLGDAISWWILT
jgi:hypothetical protein